MRLDRHRPIRRNCLDAATMREQAEVAPRRRSNGRAGSQVQVGLGGAVQLLPRTDHGRCRRGPVHRCRCIEQHGRRAEALHRLHRIDLA